MGTENEQQSTIARPAVTGWSLVGIDKPVKGAVFPIPAKAILGRDKQCDIVLDSPLISRQHAELEATAEGLMVRDLGSANGTFVSGEKVDRLLVIPGTEIRFDVIRFHLQGPSRDRNITQLRPVVSCDTFAHFTTKDTLLHLENGETASLVGLGDFAGNCFILEMGRLHVGRGEENDILLNDPTVSLQHASVVASGDGWYVEDNDSSNGTFVGDRQVTRQLLSHKDIIRFGTVRLQYENPGKMGDHPTGLQSLQEEETRTSMTPIVHTPSPWKWGIGSFLLVTAIISFAYLLLR